MCRMVILVLLLIQVLSAFGRRCDVDGNRKYHGECVRNEECGTETVFKCSNGLFCCPPDDYQPPVTQRPNTTPDFSNRFRISNSKCGVTPHYPIETITGGPKIQPDEFSWVASLEYNHTRNTFGYCAGSVIRSRFVITAAHCVVGVRARQYGPITAVRLGDFNGENWRTCDYGGTDCKCLRLEVTERIVHPEYKQGIMSANDIALLKLETEIQFTDKLVPICLPSPSDVIDLEEETLIACGWGSTMLPHNPKEKRAAALAVMSNESCDYTEPGKHICAGGGGNNTCDGDSGGPLMRNGNGKVMVLEGITSKGYTDCKKQSSIFTPVRNYLDWINEIVNSHDIDIK